MKFLTRRWQKVLFWTIVAYLIMASLLFAFSVFLGVSITMSEYGPEEFLKYTGCVKTDAEVIWCLLKKDMNFFAVLEAFFMTPIYIVWQFFL